MEDIELDKVDDSSVPTSLRFLVVFETEIWFCFCVRMLFLPHPSLQRLFADLWSELSFAIHTQPAAL